MLVKTLLRSLAPAGPRSKLSVLIFHRVLSAPDALLRDEPDAPRFEAMMRWVAGWFNVLSLGEAVERLARGTLPERPLCITFDDGYADNYHVAYPILQRLNLPATFFVATDFLDGGRMWNDVIIHLVRACPHNELDLRPYGLGSYAVGSIEEKRQTMAAVLNSMKYLPHGARGELTNRLAELAPTPVSDTLMMSASQVRHLHRSGMTIGAHTGSHPILRGVSLDEARTEILRSKRRLEEIIEDRVTLFAYPNGKPGVDYCAEHVTLIQTLGFAAGVTTSPGASRFGNDPYQVPRFTPWDRQRVRFGLRLARNLTQSGVCAT